MSKLLAYYPGCSLHGSAEELESSFKATADALEIELKEIPQWSCCGNTAVHSANRLLALALPTHELAKVEQDMQLDAVAIPCAGCFNRFATSNVESQEPEKAGHISDVVGREYNGSVAVHNLVDVYHDDVGLEELKARVTRPFQGLKVACYYGCLLTRPPKATLAGDPEYPTHMEEVAEALGCNPIDWNCKTDCCGSGLALCETAMVIELVHRLLRDARACGAEAIVCACPLCQMNLDTTQREIAKAHPDWEPIPIIYLSQLVGRAIEVEESMLGLKKLIVDARAVMA
ncbi:MAG: CoB--CoM heterodisulfide reductase iron-sulfur subunit B family protein [Actinobacteria bacterium]|nr:CoB--CoM heterodisulfide reductase iron-sulfur subunit B family protein [Actinomycetota bacterium]